MTIESRIEALERRVAALEAVRAGRPGADNQGPRTKDRGPRTAKAVHDWPGAQNALGTPPLDPAAPISGKALYAHCRALEEQHGMAILAPLLAWAAARKWTSRIGTWSRRQVAEGYAEARRIADGGGT